MDIDNVFTIKVMHKFDCNKDMAKLIILSAQMNESTAQLQQKVNEFMNVANKEKNIQ